MLGVSLLIGALSTESKIGLAVVGGAFIIFSLISALVLPARYPNYPGKHVGWYVAAGILFFVAMISAVLVFGKEEPVAEGATTAAESTASTPTSTTSSASTTTTSSTPSSGGKGDPAAGKAVFESSGCKGCHTLQAANATGTVGPNLDTLKPPFARIVLQVTNGGKIMPPFRGQLTKKQIDDVAAFVFVSTHS
jgi:mono/diheme cytochrome c family protein